MTGSKTRPMAWYRCERCGAPFLAAIWQREVNGRARVCSHRCAARGAYRYPPELVEVVELMYPDTSNNAIGGLVGLTERQVAKIAEHRRFRKSDEWLRAHGLHGNVGPQDPELRAVWGAQRALKGLITAKTKELAHG